MLTLKNKILKQYYSKKKIKTHVDKGLGQLARLGWVLESNHLPVKKSWSYILFSTHGGYQLVGQQKKSTYAKSKAT